MTQDDQQSPDTTVETTNDSSDQTNESGSIADRIRRIRMTHFGARGQSAFARAIGINVTRYMYYERDRLPPADILARMCEATGVDPTWLLLGQQSDRPGTLSVESQAIVTRVVHLLGEKPQSAVALESFLEVLEEAEHARSTAGLAGNAITGTKTQPAHTDSDNESDAGKESAPTPAKPVKVQGPITNWIPVIGRAAAGSVLFWTRGQMANAATRVMDALRNRATTEASVQQAIIEDRLTGSPGTPVPGRLLQLSQPVEFGEIQFSEFVEAPELLQRWPDSFAMRIDGNSMAPTLPEGTVVIASPSRTARTGDVAVLSLHNQIGTTCKVWMLMDEQTVHLVSLNKEYDTIECARSLVGWAFAVVGVVRAV